MCQPRLSSDGKATSQKQQHARECSRLPPLTAELGHSDVNPLTMLCIRNAAEVTGVEEQQMSSERNIEVDKLN